MSSDQQNKILNINSSTVVLVVFILGLFLFVLALVTDAFDLQDAILRVLELELGDELPDHIHQALGVHGQLLAYAQTRLASSQSSQQDELVLVVLVQAVLLLSVVPDSLQNLSLLHSLAYSTAVPNTPVACQHAANAVVVFGVGHSVNLDVDIYFVVGEELA